MKKSKILAPALALTIFSTAAAVTGTVAWYFAQRAVSIKSTVTSFNPEAGLKVTLTPGVGTIDLSDNVGTGVDSESRAEIAHELIRDGSVDLENETVYAGIRNRQGNALTGFSAIANDAGLLAGKTASDKNYYYATKFTAEFELTKKDDNATYALYYDNSLLQVTSGSKVQESLRIGVVTTAGYFVIAPFRNEVPHLVDDPNTNEDESQLTGLKYVAGEALATARGDYDADGKALYGFATTITPDDPATTEVNEYAVTVGNTVGTDNLNGLEGEVASASAAGILGYMGQMTKAQTITATIYTWFEGEDPANLAANVDDQQVATSLGFQILEIA